MSTSGSLSFRVDVETTGAPPPPPPPPIDLSTILPALISLVAMNVALITIQQAFPAKGER